MPLPPLSPVTKGRAIPFHALWENARCSGPAILRDEGHRRVRLARQHGNLEVPGAELCGGFRRRDRVAGCRGRIHVLCQQPRRKGYFFSLSLSLVSITREDILRDRDEHLASFPLPSPQPPLPPPPTDRSRTIVPSIERLGNGKRH